VSRKLTLNEVKIKLYELNTNISIISELYEHNKSPLECECLKCYYKWTSNWSALKAGRGCSQCKSLNARLDKQSIIDFVEKEGYVFISFTKGDKASNYRMDISCSEGHKYNVKYKDFKAGSRCKKCFYSSGISGVRKSQDDVIRELSNLGYTVPTDFTYKNYNTKFDSFCSDGHLRHDNFASITDYPECPLCKWGRESFRYTEEDVKKILIDWGLEYISGFENTHSLISFKCHCGNIDSSRIHSLENSRQCRECSNRKKYTLEELQKIFSDEGCSLLETEVSKVSNLRYLCSCGNSRSVSLYDFRRGVRCMECGTKQRSGENHPSWNPNLTDDEREKNRKYPEYKSWRLEVYRRDHFTCQCCGDNKGHNLNAHHLNSHDWAIDQRLDVDNGITLCDTCHTDFHNLYDYGDNTREQYEEYIKELYNNAI
jgi:hypothetical protein